MLGGDEWGRRGGPGEGAWIYPFLDVILGPGFVRIEELPYGAFVRIQEA